LGIAQIVQFHVLPVSYTEYGFKRSPHDKKGKDKDNQVTGSSSPSEPTHKSSFVESHMLTIPYAFFAPILAFSALKDSLLGHVKHQTTLTTSQINEFTPFTHFASTAYCDPDTTVDWTCGGKISLMVTWIIFI